MSKMVTKNIKLTKKYEINILWKVLCVCGIKMGDEMLSNCVMLSFEISYCT